MVVKFDLNFDVDQIDAHVNDAWQAGMRLE